MSHEEAREQLAMAKIRASLANERTNEAQAAEKANAPKAWTATEEAELVNKLHGTPEERIQKLIDQANRRP